MEKDKKLEILTEMIKRTNEHLKFFKGNLVLATLALILLIVAHLIQYSNL